MTVAFIHSFITGSICCMHLCMKEKSKQKRRRRRRINKELDRDQDEVQCHDILVGSISIVKFPWGFKTEVHASVQPLCKANSFTQMRILPNLDPKRPLH
ncbi:hypothetical protein I3843_13G002500 [Carya illinoinensis]|uniref:Uncharacterized protein n=1 Tax=Carya illinoinensis TaxID=32201 RepID=A0A8T1NKI4_CARIL|nr:hypothetical protein I3760_13G004100 [Carya illinoinensis]KAG6630232.1 hypothetical protein CIPAW_13G004100 [Carya illinoinensis]KAG6679651.1 hypothetical protein I3842_13G003800 [Carya illinoinensis]KAG7948271.1 hypothetical protein I3843_13G002500 [Carya illinoinensis]